MVRIAALAAGLFLMLAPSVVVAQDTGREARMAMAERAFNALQADQMAEQMTALMQSLPQQGMSDLSGPARVAYDETLAETMQFIMGRTFEGAVSIYADTYTLEELTALATFYESPVGQSIMQKSNQMTPQIIALMRGIMPDALRHMANGMCDRIGCTADERRQLIQMVLAQSGLVES